MKHDDAMAYALFGMVMPLVIVLVLSACATDQSKPEVVTKVVQLPPVRIPVLVPCVDAAQVPDIPSTTFTPDQATWEKAQKDAALGILDTLLVYTNVLQKEAMAAIDSLKAYALKADPLLRGCAREPPAPTLQRIVPLPNPKGTTK